MAQRQGQDQLHHDAIVLFVARELEKDRFKDVKADVPDFPEPEAIQLDHAGIGHLPDVTAVRSGLLHIYEVETPDTVSINHTQEQWKIFATYAKEHGAKFTIVVPRGTEARVKALLPEMDIRASVWPVVPM